MDSTADIRERHEHEKDGVAVSTENYTDHMIKALKQARADRGILLDRLKAAESLLECRTNDLDQLQCGYDKCHADLTQHRDLVRFNTRDLKIANETNFYCKWQEAEQKVVNARHGLDAERESRKKWHKRALKAEAILNRNDK